MAHYPIEALLRAPVEWSSSLAAVSLAAIAWRAPDLLMMTRPVAQRGGGGIVPVGAGARVSGLAGGPLSAGLRRTRPYRLSASALDPDPAGLFLGRGFLWTARHTQRLWDATRAANRRFVEVARPASGRPPESGLPALHGVGTAGRRGADRAAARRTAGACLLCRHHRRGQDPGAGAGGPAGYSKRPSGHLHGPPRAIRRCSAACTAKPSGRNARSTFFHLGYPEHSARYNPIGRFSRLTEVATRIANQLPAQGNAEAFRQFAWLFTHMVGQALFRVGGTAGLPQDPPAHE